MSNVRVVCLVEKPGRGRLGRMIEHDARSMAFPMAIPSHPLVTVDWPRFCDPFDQGDIGSCTGNAMAGALMTGPLFLPGRELSETDAVELYSEATRLDRVPGFYPPDDTGSSGLAVARAAKRRGWLSEYRHAFGLSAALHGISRGPVLIGINWYSGFDSPEGDVAELVISGEIRGGHELVVDGIDVESGMIKITNSWGLGWGAHGKCVMSFGTFNQLLKESGDVVVPIAWVPSG